MGDDLSGVIAELATGTYTVTRRSNSIFSEGTLVQTVDVTAWVGGTTYAVGDQRKNGLNIYECITAGAAAASGGPTGTASDITDGAAHWKYLTLAATTVSALAVVQPLTGRELSRLSEGMREMELLSVWTATALRGALNGNDPDSIVIDGDVYEVQKVERWNTLGNYYKAIVAKVTTR